jgi:hypothetical protein
MKVYEFNGIPISAPLSIESNKPLFISDTVDLGQRRLSQEGQRWEVSFGLQTRGQTEADFFVDILTNFGVTNTMIMPQLNHVNNVTPAASLVDPYLSIPAGTTPAGAISVPKEVFSGTNRVLPKGSFIRFSNHWKIYMLRTNVNRNSSSFPIYPSLRAPVTGSASVLWGDAALLRYYVDISTLQGTTYSDGVLMNPGVIRLIEAV